MADTYVVLHKKITRVHEDGSVEVFEVGDEIEPTEAELKSFRDKLRISDGSRVSRPIPGGIGVTGNPPQRAFPHGQPTDDEGKQPGEGSDEPARRGPGRPRNADREEAK